MAFRKRVVKCAVPFILFAGSLAAAQARPPKFAVVRTIVLHRKVNGIAGTVQLLLDKRLTQPARAKLWGQGDWSFVFPEHSALYKEFSALPPRNAELRILDAAGRVVVERNLERPLAKLEAWNPMSRRNQLFLLTQDYSTGAGSYNGPGTTVLEVSGGVLRDVTALDTESHKEEPFRLVRSLKSDWKVSRRTNGGEILSISCHPNRSGRFVIDYIRYSLVGKQWREYKREVRGFWESDSPFPKRSAFP